jgi:hypothetical protein
MRNAYSHAPNCIAVCSGERALPPVKILPGRYAMAARYRSQHLPADPKPQTAEAQKKTPPEEIVFRFDTNRDGAMSDEGHATMGSDDGVVGRWGLYF